MWNERKYDFNIKSKSGKNCVFAACKFGHVEVLKMLQSYGMSLKAEKPNGDTVLGYALCRGNIDAFLYLLNYYIENNHLSKTTGRLNQHWAIVQDCILEKYDYVTEDDKEEIKKKLDTRLKEEGCEIFRMMKMLEAEQKIKLIGEILKNKKCKLLKYEGMQKVGINSLLVQHISEVLEYVHDANIWNNEENVKYLLENIPYETFSQYRNSNNMNFLSVIVKYGDYMGNFDIIYPYLNEKILNRKTNTAKKLNARLKEILVQDKDGLTFLDYCFHKRIGQMLILIEGIDKEVRQTEGDKNVSHNILIPSMIEVKVEYKNKEKEKVENEKKMMKANKDMIMEYNKKKGEGVTFKGMIGYERYDKVLRMDDTKKLKEELEFYKNLKEETYVRVFKLKERGAYDYVRDAKGLKQMLEEIRKSTAVISIDVEYVQADQSMNESENKEFIVSSLQISSPYRNYFVDCIELKNEISACKEFKTLMESHECIKLLHGSDNDVDVIYKTYGTVLANVFDTSKAALLLQEYDNMPGLNTLAKDYMGVLVDKAFQRAIWKVRPLTAPMLEYAITDSIMLIPIFYHQLSKLLKMDEMSRERLMMDIWCSSNNIYKSIKLKPTYPIFL